MSAKQIKFFGTPAQKAGLKRSRAAKRNTSHRIRSRPKAKRKNFGEIVSLSLGAANPARKRKANKAMAKTKRRRASAHRARTNAPRRRRRSTAVVHHRRRTRRSNPVTYHRRRRHNPVVHHRRRGSRRNPLGTGWGATFVEGLGVLSGLLGSKYVAQMILGTSNTGIMGYAANLGVGVAGGWAAGSLLKKPKLGQAFLIGAVIEVIVRVLEDYTPFGQYTSGMGVGDYFASNWVTPQRYTDALHSAQVQIPGGWAPSVVVQSNAAPKGSLSGYDGMDGM